MPYAEKASTFYPEDHTLPTLSLSGPLQTLASLLCPIYFQIFSTRSHHTGL
jgi:hypothetical protein